MRETIPIFKSTLSFYKEYILIFLKEKVNVCCLRDSLIVSLFVSVIHMHNISFMLKLPPYVKSDPATINGYHYY